jgi:hypothetical protein
MLQSVSNPIEVQHNLSTYLNKPIDLYQSTRKNKKYMVQNEDHKWRHFGDIRYSDYTKHQDSYRRARYLQRALNIRGTWKNDPYSPNNLSIYGLWSY